MMVKIGDYKVDVLDRVCPARTCYSLFSDKGSFVVGVGYTHYHTRAKWVCGTRHLRGCPHPPPEADPDRERERVEERGRALERSRCCHAPQVRHTPKTHRQRCLTCGAWLTGTLLRAVRDGRLPQKFACRHTGAKQGTLRGWWELLLPE